MDTIIEVVKVLLSAMKDTREWFRDRSKLSQSEVEVGTLISMYGSATTLMGHLEKLHGLARQREAEEDEGTGPFSARFFWEKKWHPHFGDFCRELARFADELNVANVAAIDIYYPGFREALVTALRGDMFVVDMYKVAASDMCIDQTSIKGPLRALRKAFNFNVHSRLIDSRKEELTAAQGREDLPEAIASLQTLMGECRSLLAQVVRENWSMRELVHGRKKEHH